MRPTIPRLSAILACSITLTVLGAGACSDDPGGPHRDGLTRVLLTDAPFPYDLVSKVEVFIQSISASVAADTGAAADEQGWVTIAEPMRRFDLLELQNGTATLVGEGALPADLYRAVRVVMDAGQSQVTLSNGAPAPVQWQGGVMSLFAFVEDPLDVPVEGASLVIDFDVGRSFLWMASSDSVPDYFLFIPSLRVVNEAGTGAIAGRVTGDPDGDGTFTALPFAPVTVFRGDPAYPSNTWWIYSSGRADAQGTYRIAYLPERSYIVRAEAPGVGGTVPWTELDVPVSAGAETGLDFALPRTNLASLVIAGPTELDVGAIATLTASVTDSRGEPLANPRVWWWTWHSDLVQLALPDSGSASASTTVTGLRPGFATVIANSYDVADTIQLRVRDPSTGPVETITLSANATTVSVGDSLIVTATLEDADGHDLFDREIEWTISNEAVLAFIGRYRNQVALNPKAPGSATITATSEGKSGSLTITVQ
jgi:hypothetical protein